MDEKTPAQERALFGLISLNVIASVFHYAHYFVYFRTYPNELDWLSPPRVDLVWFLITAVGVVGYLLFKRHRYLWSFPLLYLYAILGLGSLGHYLLAPMAAHSIGTNLLIWSEATVAGILLLYVIRLHVYAHRDGDDGMVFQ